MTRKWNTKTRNIIFLVSYSYYDTGSKHKLMNPNFVSKPLNLIITYYFICCYLPTLESAAISSF